MCRTTDEPQFDHDLLVLAVIATLTETARPYADLKPITPMFADLLRGQ